MSGSKMMDCDLLEGFIVWLQSKIDAIDQEELDPAVIQAVKAALLRYLGDLKTVQDTLIRIGIDKPLTLEIKLKPGCDVDVVAESLRLLTAQIEMSNEVASTITQLNIKLEMLRLLDGKSNLQKEFQK